MPKKIIIAAGGTGGHIIPAQVTAMQISDRCPAIDYIFVGGGLSQNRFFQKESFPFEMIACSPMSFGKPFQIPKSCLSILKGIKESAKIIRGLKPDLLVGFGSYHTAPVLLAAVLLRTPFVLYAADSIPGKVITYLSRFAKATGVNFPSAKKFLKGKVVEVNLPLRKGYKKGTISKEEAAFRYKLNPDYPILLILGGSQGAKALNDLMARSCHLLPSDWQILHIVGDQSMVRNYQTIYSQVNRKSFVVGYEERMDIAWQAADWALSRAGASSIAEMLEFEVPSLLVPFPFSADGHQDLNAHFMQTEVKGGVAISQDRLNPELLSEQLGRLAEISDTMRKSMQNYKKSSREKNLVDLIIECLDE